ncbi:hypothetical protein [Halorubrum sp. CSM-61]|uniref:hypothetical protein n=1 Tax=Halorubrum sp. CSM-61 TaxID=2485838 RepID=UPI000F4B00FA|nr:hypothetical protein [Halorubrum sp. CSM-61]
MRRTIALLLVGVVIIAGVAAPAAAQSDSTDDGLVSELFGSTGQSIVDQVRDDPIGFAQNVVAAASGAASSANPFGGADRTPAECAADIQTEINDNNAAYATYLNDRVEANASRDVVAIHCSKETRDGFSTDVITETVYLTATVNNSTDPYTYENLSVVNETSMTVDEEVTLTDSATTDGPDDLVEFRKEYVSKNETPPRNYLARIGGKYGNDVSGTFDFLQ